MTLPQWTLDGKSIALAESKGFVYSVTNGKFILKRKKDEARIWPHIDGFVSCFVRGWYVQHKKYKDLARALDRRFGD